MKHDRSLLYPFGFLLGTDAPGQPAHFERASFPVPLWVNCNTSYATATKGECTCFLTGEIVLPAQPQLTISELAQRLARSGSKYQDIVDQFIGRFAVAMILPSGLFVQNDASGMRSLYFDVSGDTPIVGTHASLVAGINEQSVSAVARFRKLGCPGISTPFENTFRLPPNVALDFSRGELQRFFPMSALQQQNLEDVWEIALQRARVAAVEFARRHSLVASLTAGRDSRVTLLALRDAWEHTKFFTYTRGIESHDVDCEVAARIASSLALNHRIIDYAEIERDRRLLTLIKRNTYGNHQHGLAMVYRQDPWFNNTLHVRSNMLEITRSNLYARGQKSPRFKQGLVDATVLASYYARVGKMEPSPHQDEAFAFYQKACDLDSALQFISSWDLFFIEHRMGAWRAGVLEESDIAFDTVNLFNSREILAAFYGVPDEERAADTMPGRLITSALPQIQEIPVNPHKVSKTA